MPGMTPIEETLPEDIFLVGYPKSGNTWLQSLVAGLVYGLNPEYMPDSLTLELVPDVHFNSFYRRYHTPTFFKTHFLPRPEYRRVVYLLRDGRDVMVSYYHHLKALNGDETDFAEIVQKGRNLMPSKWHTHVQRWNSNPFGAEVLTLKYEDLLKNPVHELRRFCAFAGVDRPIEVFDAVIQKSSFSKMRDREKELGWSNPAWPKDRFFVRRGVAGSYKDEMPPQVLDLFLAEAAPALRAHGYLQ